MEWEALAAASGYRVEEMARKRGISTRHLRRLFQKEFKTSPKHQLDEWRAMAAAAQLKRGGLVKTTASDQKFKHPSHFSKFIKRTLKALPRDYRQQ
jgi:AraC-like DNA-binding protein